MIIYKITNLKNGKIYIGQTVQELRGRWHEHSRPRRGSDATRSAISAAIQLYGKESFKSEVIDTAASLDELNIKEATYIKAFNCLAPNGYNLHLGGNSRECHEETRERIRQTLKGRPITNRWTGGNRTPRTDAQKANLSAKIKGRPNVVLHKRVECVETGETFESVNAAAEAFSCVRQTITSLLKSGKQGGKLKTKGRSFRYCEDKIG